MKKFYKTSDPEQLCATCKVKDHEMCGVAAEMLTADAAKNVTCTCCRQTVETDSINETDLCSACREKDHDTCGDDASCPCCRQAHEGASR